MDEAGVVWEAGADEDVDWAVVVVFSFVVVFWAAEDEDAVVEVPAAGTLAASEAAACPF